MARRAKVSKDEAAAPVDVAEALSEEAAPPPPPAPAPTYAQAGPTGGSGNGRRGLLSRMYGDVGESKPEERDRMAAMEWQAAISPVMDLLQASVPDASSPEEAARSWEQRSGPVIPDPDGGSYLPGDAFETDARVYYRLLRRDYEADPRPGQGGYQPYYLGKLARKHNKSHYLPAPYGQRPGIKGW